MRQSDPGPALLSWRRRAMAKIALVEAVGLALAAGGARLAWRRLHPPPSAIDDLFRASSEAMWVYDVETLRIVAVNAAAVEQHGSTEAKLLERTLHDLRTPEDIAELRRLHARAPDGAFTRQWRQLREDGSAVFVTTSSQPVDWRGRRARLVIAHDTTGASEAAARTRAILASVGDAILTLDLEGRIESLNPAAEELFGLAEQEVVGDDLSVLMVGDDGDGAGRRPAALPPAGDVLGRRRDGTVFPLELTVSEVALGDGALTTVVARDVSERRSLEEALAHRGTHDALTGLPNRTLFLDRLEHALARAARSGRPLAVLFCDLDGFKAVNDSLGHAAGDALLTTVAGRFTRSVRGGDTVGRFGGDEFVVLAEELSSTSDATTVADQLVSALRSPVSVDGQELVVGVSIGIAVGGSGDGAEALLRDADAALYRAKARGRDRVELFDADLRRSATARHDLHNALRRALREDELEVHFQPEVDLATDRVVGVEALVRWRRADGCVLAPDSFLAVAQETGLIVPMGERVLELACREASRWHERADGCGPRVWVNVCARQLGAPGLVASVRACVDRWLPSAGALGLEITESELVPDDGRVQTVITELTDLGVCLAIDDFGTGYASLAYLWRVRADVVKIDRSFVQRLEEEREATVIVAAIVQLARSLGKTTVAEGIETEGQLARVRRLGCDVGQGFLFGRPAPPPVDVARPLVRARSMAVD